MKIVDDDKLADSGYELNAKQNSGDDWSKIKVFVNNYKKSYTYEDTFEINITNDGGIKKKIIVKGKGEKPKNGDLVTILYIENKNRFELFPKRKIIKTFVLGSKKIMKGM